MSFWGKDDWKVTVENEKHIVLHGPGVDYVFDKHDFLQLQKNINAVDLTEKEEWFIHDDTIISRSTGEQLIGVIDDCAKLNELHDENQKLQEENEQLNQKHRQLQIDYNELVGINTDYRELTYGLTDLIVDLGSEEMRRQMKQILNKSHISEFKCWAVKGE